MSESIRSMFCRRALDGRCTFWALSIGFFGAMGCSSTSNNQTTVVESSGGTNATGGTRSAGGNATGGASSSVGTGGAATGGQAATGGLAATGGQSSAPNASGGNIATGGKGTGGNKPTGGSQNGGAATGGKATSGGAAAGGAATGGNAATGGTSAAQVGGKSSTGGANTGGGAAGGKSSTGGTGNTAGQSNGGAATGGNGNAGQSSGGSTNPGPKSAGCGKAPGIASNQYNNGTSINITAAGWQRRYVLNVPTNYDNTHAYKLVLTMHARDGNDKQMYAWQYYGLLPESKNTAIFVAPNGQVNGAPCSGTSSQGESSCGWPNTDGKDLALVDAVVAQIEENFCVDTDHIFATGWSYGGSMSYDIACERPLSNVGTAGWGVRAIAIYSAAQLSGNCTPKSPVAYYHSHGTRDSVLNYDSMGMPLAQNFSKANGCTWATPTKVSSGNHVCTNMTGCTDGYPLEFCSFNGDHTPYPDTGSSNGSWGPVEAWKFLNQF